MMHPRSPFGGISCESVLLYDPNRVNNRQNYFAIMLITNKIIILLYVAVLKNEEHHKLLDEAPNKFLEMVKEMGEFAAIEAMLKSVCLK